MKIAFDGNSGWVEEKREFDEESYRKEAQEFSNEMISRDINKVNIKMNKIV